MIIFQAIRGAASSFGIVTQTTLSTLPAPNSTTTYEYGWTLNINDATSAFQSYQSFSLSNPTPPELGIELQLARGSARGTVTLMLSGAWYGAAGQFATVIKPLLSTVPQNPHWSKKKVGTYLDSLNSLAGGSVSVSAPDTHDTFYAKSLITPNDSRKQVSALAMRMLMTYLGNTGFDSKLVSVVP